MPVVDRIRENVPAPFETVEIWAASKLILTLGIGLLSPSTTLPVRLISCASAGKKMNRAKDSNENLAALLLKTDLQITFIEILLCKFYLYFK